MTQDSRETVGAFLLRRLTEIGVSTLFGVAGDFNLELLELVEADGRLRWVGCCNELNAAYAADGYARMNGPGVLVTTYGVGELSALLRDRRSLRRARPRSSRSSARRRSGRWSGAASCTNTAGDGDYDNMMSCGRAFATASARITPQNAISEIDRCLRACILEKRPVYLQLPSDIAATRIETGEAAIQIEFTSDQGVLESFAKAAAWQIDSGSSVAILADADIGRYGLQSQVLALADELGCSVAVMGTAKGMLDETHPAYAGLYAGAASPGPVRGLVEEADCLIRLSVRFVDSTTAAFSETVAPKRSVEIGSWSARVDGEDFNGICMADAIAKLTEAVGPRTGAMLAKPEAAAAVEAEAQVTQAWFWSRLNAFVRPGDVLVAENGTSLAGVNGLSLPAGVTVHTQVLWGAIGYSLPATFGSMMAAPGRRHILFIGDGSFQLTAQELSSMLRHRCTGIIFLINNDGYTIERLILGERSSYNDIQRWDYAALPGVFADAAPFQAVRATTPGEVEAALQAVLSDQLTFIEVVMDRMDAPASLTKLGPIYARQDYGSFFAGLIGEGRSK